MPSTGDLRALSLADCIRNTVNDSHTVSLRIIFVEESDASRIVKDYNNLFIHADWLCTTPIWYLKICGPRHDMGFKKQHTCTLGPPTQNCMYCMKGDILMHLSKYILNDPVDSDRILDMVPLVSFVPILVLLINNKNSLVSPCTQTRFCNITVVLVVV